MRVSVPSLPATSKLKEPVAWARSTERVRVLEPVGLTDAGEKPQEMPAGLPEQERFTVPE